MFLKPLSASVALIQKPVTANQLTSFYMRATLALNGLNRSFLWVTLKCHVRALIFDYDRLNFRTLGISKFFGRKRGSLKKAVKNKKYKKSFSFCDDQGYKGKVYKGYLD